MLPRLALEANSLITHQITFSVMPAPQTAPVRFTHLKSRPSLTFAAAVQQSTTFLTQPGTGTLRM